MKMHLQKKKKKMLSKDRTRVMQDEKRRVPLIYHRATTFPMKIFSTFRIKYVENLENVNQRFQFLCVSNIIFNENIFHQTLPNIFSGLIFIFTENGNENHQTKHHLSFY